MKHWVLDKIFNKPSAPRHIEYLAFDRNFQIIDFSQEVQRFADDFQEVEVGKDVRDSFPELVGVEDILLTVLEGEEEYFEYKAIARYSAGKSPLYIDIYVIGDEEEKTFGKRLFMFLEDVTQRMILEQKLVQRTNEAELLLTKLTASQNYIFQIISSMADAFIVTNSVGDIKAINKATEALFEYSEAELLGQPIYKIIADYEIINHLNQQNSRSAGEVLKDIQLICYTKSGKKLRIEFSLSSNQTEIKDIQDLIYIGRDITERQRIEKRFLAQFVTTRILSESANLEQATPKILLALCESLGWAFGELWMPKERIAERVREGGRRNEIVNSYLQLRCVETWCRSDAKFSELIAVTKQITFQPGEGLPGRIWVTGSPLWITDVVEDPTFLRSRLALAAGLHAALGFPIQSDREVLGVMVFYTPEKQDIDEELLQMMVGVGCQIGQFIKRKSAEMALLESEERYRDLFENASDLIQSVTPDGHFIYVNSAWRESLGYQEEEIDQMTVFDIIHPDCRSRCLEIFQRVMSGEKIERVEVVFLSKYGKKIFLEGSVNCKIINGIPVATRAILRDITERKIAEEALRYQQQQTERLLLNILPETIAAKLKQDRTTIAESFEEVTVMFADIVGFTELSSRVSPTELVEILNVIFSEFDHLAEKHGLEKIKTIGDAYMVVGGLPKPQSNHAIAIAEMAIDMQTAITQFSHETGQSFSMRIGINTGSVVAGVIGTKKFIYDLWGDTVNIASRMESHGLPGYIQVTQATYEYLRDRYLFEQRGEIPIKGKGIMNTYFLIASKSR